MSDLHILGYSVPAPADSVDAVNVSLFHRPTDFLAQEVSGAVGWCTSKDAGSRYTMQHLKVKSNIFYINYIFTLKAPRDAQLMLLRNNNYRI